MIFVPAYIHMLSWYAEFALMQELHSLPQLFGTGNHGLYNTNSTSSGGIVEDLLSLDHH
jgi:hypothetical protein